MIPAAALGFVRPGNRLSDFVEQGDDVDGQAATFAGAGRFPIQEIEAVFTFGVENNQVLRTATVCGPLLPLAALFFLGAKHQRAHLVAESNSGIHWSGFGKGGTPLPAWLRRRRLSLLARYVANATCNRAFTLFLLRLAWACFPCFRWPRASVGFS
jgi:hypothetical protein